MKINVNEKLNELLDGYAEEMTVSLRELIRIKSVVGEVDETKAWAPYGQGVQAAFDHVMKLGLEKGFECVNLENRAGELNFGSGEESVGVICHLDVVPEGNGWNYPPYEGVMDNGNIYGRGAVDDKGCFIASFYACLALKESGLPLRRRVKHIIGTNEETGGFPCIQYYKKHTQDMPVCGIVPDSWFPVAYAEKGIVNYDFTGTFESPQALDSHISLIRLVGGGAYNIVAPDATASFSVTAAGAAKLRAAVENFVEGDQSEPRDGLSIADRIEISEETGTVVIRTIGKSAHASTPEIGVNAISLLLRILKEIDFAPADLCGALRVLAEQVGFDSDGSGLGIACADHSGPLTNNVGLVEYDGELLSVKMNLRSPVSTTIEELSAGLAEAAEKAGMKSEIVLYNPHFYMDPNDELIQLLVAVYQSMTGDLVTKPKSHGGGSYARILKNFVPFGPSIEGEELSFHKQDEHISCDRLLLLSKLYAQALYQMAK